MMPTSFEHLSSNKVSTETEFNINLRLDWQIQCQRRLFAKKKFLKSRPSFVFVNCRIIKGELQRQNKLILFERPLKILQNETKISGVGCRLKSLKSVKPLYRYSTLKIEI